MDNQQIESIVNSCPLARRNFQGVYAADTLPSTPPRLKPSTYICNLDTIDRPGSHWVAFYVPEQGDVEYFDSYGMIAPSIFHEFLGHDTYLYNERCVQYPLSATCGQYAIYYIWMRSIINNMNDVLSVFTDVSLLYNDILVNRIIENHFGVDLDVFDVPWQLKQF